MASAGCSAVRTLAPAGKFLSCSRGASRSSSRVGISRKRDIPERVAGSGLPGATLGPFLNVLQGVSYGFLRRHVLTAVSPHGALDDLVVADEGARHAAHALGVPVSTFPLYKRAV